MPRPTRIQYKNALYHVVNRGLGRRAIFHGEDYYTTFLETLDEAHKRFDAEIHAYCLMGSHFHLLVKTPRANLDQIMRHINGVYTQRYNQLKHADGPLFRGRYKSVLIDEKAYLLPLSRYIHRSPAEVKGTSADALEKYKWSSYPAYTNRVATPTWLQREATYKALGRRHRYKGYKDFTEQGNEEDFLKFYSKGNLASIMGEKAFREAIKNRRDEYQVSAELSRALSNRPKIPAIVSAVAKVFKTSVPALKKRQQGRQYNNVSRQMAIYCCQYLGDHSLNEIADYFQLTHSGSVSAAVSAVKKRLQNGELESELKKLKRVLRITV